jgi:hypothetical protein
VSRKKRTVTETETHRVVTLHGRLMRGCCDACGQDAQMGDTGVAAKTLSITVAELRSRLANSGGHSTEVGGILCVCRA